MFRQYPLTMVVILPLELDKILLPDWRIER